MMRDLVRIRYCVVKLPIVNYYAGFPVALRAKETDLRLLAGF